jgi:hypothetical protein
LRTETPGQDCATRLDGDVTECEQLESKMMARMAEIIEDSKTSGRLGGAQLDSRAYPQFAPRTLRAARRV